MEGWGRERRGVFREGANIEEGFDEAMRKEKKEEKWGRREGRCMTSNRNPSQAKPPSHLVRAL